MGRFTGQIPSAVLQSSYGMFQSRMIAKPSKDKGVPKSIEIVKRSGIEEFRKGIR